MPAVKFQSANFQLQENESVLDCLLRNSQHIPYACKAGMCQACIVKADEGTPPEEARKWIKKSLQKKGYCLACQWVPQEDISVSLPSLEEFSVEVLISEMTLLNSRVMRLRLKPSEAGTLFAYEPGQYLSLINPAGITRSYSIANNFELDGFVELHIGQTPQGLFTSWLFSEAKVDQILHIRGPAGDCFYDPAESDESIPLLLAGTGTGLAPLYGIINQALKKNHQGPITLYQGGRSPEALYYIMELSELAKRHDNFHYYPVCPVLPENTPNQWQQGTMDSIVTAQLDTKNIASTKVYLCGNPDFVHSLRKQIFLKGARSSSIFCDPFLEREVSSST